MTPFYSLIINDILAYFAEKDIMTRGIMIGAILASAGLALLVLLVPAIRTAFSFTSNELTINTGKWIKSNVQKPLIFLMG
jgi:hypothetical protein